MVYPRRSQRPSPKQPKPRRAVPKSWPAPVSGWVSNRALSSPESIEGPGAAILDNFFPQSTGVVLRAGKARYATLEDETLGVGALFTYDNGSNERMFGANINAIYDLTSVSFSQPADIVTEDDEAIEDGLGNVFGWNSTQGLVISDGYTSDDWTVIQFATTGGTYLIGVNGVDPGFIFDGTYFFPIVADGVSQLAFDAKTGDFTAGEVVTGGTSGATATIQQVADEGTGSGILFLVDVVGTFVDGEALTDPVTGAADADGVVSNAVPGIDFGALSSADMTFVWSFKQRLYFCQRDSLSSWYLDVDSIGGTATEFPMGGVFTNGGSLLFGARWSLEYGVAGGLSEQNIFVSTEGEVAIYQGSSPDEASTWSIVGLYRIGSPLGKRAYIRGGGDLAIATTVGLVPLSKAISLDVTALNVASVSYKITDAWTEALNLRGEAGWQAMVWPERKMVLISPPDMIGSSSPVMFISNTETGAWARYSNWLGLSMCVFRGDLYFGSDLGRVFQAEAGGLDDGEPYSGAVVPLFSDLEFGSGIKVGKSVMPTVRSTASIVDSAGILTDYKLNLPAAPDATPVVVSNEWGSGEWGVSRWDATTLSNVSQKWRSAGGVGYALAPWYQITSGAEAALRVELVAFETLHTVGEAMT